MDVSARFLQTALDGIDDCINIVDKKFQIIFINEAASKRVGKKLANNVRKQVLCTTVGKKRTV